MKLTIKYTLLLVFFQLGIGHAQKKRSSSPNYTIIFHYAGKKKLPDTVWMHSIPNGKFWENEKNTKYWAVKKNDSVFTLQLPKLKAPLSVTFRATTDHNSSEIHSPYALYYAENNDDVHLNVYKPKINTGGDSVVFSGTGATKYSLVDRVIDYYRITPPPLYANNRVVEHKDQLDSTSLEKKFSEFAEIINQRSKARSNLIFGQSKQISNNIKKLIDYNTPDPSIEYWGPFVQSYYDPIPYNSNYKKLFSTLLDKYMIWQWKNTDALCLLSPMFFTKLENGFINTKLKVGSPNNKISLVNYYNEVKKFSNNPQIRERALSEFFMNSSFNDIGNYSVAIYDSLVIDASKYMISTSGKDIIFQKLNFTKGKKMFDGDFIDLNGKLLNTSSLKGKVFMLEAWGEGCGGCAVFHKAFDKEIWPKLKNNKDFIVLSVFSGSTKEGWKRGIESGLYTDDAYLNVAVLNGGMMKHPFFMHYRVNYNPFTLLIDKDGNILANIVPGMSMDTILKLINSELIFDLTK
ncbi:TlpA family protein disulfide reductase [Pedobacter hartonius]|uniref:Thioredoxin domain-containing protein n=1 Tax=Pedobacter hartonius TaxID=425514 RepID=A0A1H4CYW1_9SPHI|nr:hypothetical protein [Pedobacter hartonius]SEA65399.1 hypothetical protein SAMN05443550_104249 [Pedobacter hartonius]